MSIESWEDLRAYANGTRDGSTANERARFRAARALTEYVDVTGDTGTDFDESIADLVTDLLHLRAIVDSGPLHSEASEILDSAARNFYAEVMGAERSEVIQ